MMRPARFLALPKPRYRSMAAMAVALAAIGLSGSCVPVCACSPVLEPDVVTALDFNAPEYLVVVGSTATVRVTPRRSDGGIAQIVGPIELVSSDTTVVTLGTGDFSTARTVRGVAVGETTLTASYEGVSATAPVRVLPQR